MPRTRAGLKKAYNVLSPAIPTTTHKDVLAAVSVLYSHYSARAETFNDIASFMVERYRSLGHKVSVSWTTHENQITFTVFDIDAHVVYHHAITV